MGSILPCCSSLLKKAFSGDWTEGGKKVAQKFTSLLASGFFAAENSVRTYSDLISIDQIISSFTNIFDFFVGATVADLCIIGSTLGNAPNQGTTFLRFSCHLKKEV